MHNYLDITKTICFDIKHDDIVFDIQNITHKYGRIQYNGENIEEVAILQVDNSEQDTEIIKQSLKRRLSELEMKMMRYIDYSETNETGTITIIYLKMPDNWPDKNVKLLQIASYEFLVNACIADYLRIVRPKDVPIYEDKAETNLNDIKYALNTRIPGTLRIPYPFKG